MSGGRQTLTVWAWWGLGIVAASFIEAIWRLSVRAVRVIQYGLLAVASVLIGLVSGLLLPFGGIAAILLYMAAVPDHQGVEGTRTGPPLARLPCALLGTDSSPRNMVIFRDRTLEPARPNPRSD